MSLRRVDTATLYHLILQSWSHKTAQPLVNTLLLFSQQYDLLKTPSITVLGAYN